MKAWHDECGVFGIWNHPESARLTYLGLYAIQHRGQEAAGIVSLEGDTHHIRKGLGLVADIFDEPALVSLRGNAAIGHVRYSTTGQNSIANAQPMTGQLFNGPLAVAHNGNIVNAEPLKLDLRARGSIFQGSNDTEVILHLIARHDSNDLLVCLKEALDKIEGAFSLTVLSHKGLFAVRDSHGFRPLVLGTLEDGPNGKPSYVVASETCAFDLIGAKYLREIEPGEIFWVDETGAHSTYLTRKAPRSACVFEHVYFSRPDSVVFGESVYEVRKRAGQALALEMPTEADIVVPVPDSGVPAAVGYAQASGLPFELGIIRNHYIGRTFIQPSQSIRDFGVKIKLNPQTAVLKGKRVIVIDDSIVRGTTSKKIVNLIRSAGATEVHLRIAAPPTVGPCYYGVDTPARSQLIAANQSLESIREFVGADSLGYLSMSGLMTAVRGGETGFCAACFGGPYPTPLFGLDLDPAGNVRGI